MTNTKPKSFKKLLYNGGELFVNRLGANVTVDVFSDQEGEDEPVYHRLFMGPTAWADAMADAELWQGWED